MVGIVVGSLSDREVVAPATAVLDEFGVPWEWRVISAHRSPEALAEYARTAEERGLRALIAAAGGAAHLPGVLAAQTILPVVGIPVADRNLGGLDALPSIAQMPPGIPVATVGIDGARNAALLAVAILALGDAALAARSRTWRRSQAEGVAEADRRLREELASR
jgi:5-(carboxyamino)imidazole ribonucleotide mutase